MNKIIKKLLIVTIIFFSCKPTKAQYSDLIKIELQLSNNKVKKIKDLNTKIKFLLRDSSIELPIRKCLNYENEFSNPGMHFIDLVVEFEKINPSGYKEKINLKGESGHEMDKCYDSLGQEQINILSKNRPMFFTKNILFNNVFLKGKYRFRVKYYIPRTYYSKLRKKYAYSDWVYFNVVVKKLGLTNFFNK